MEILQVLIQVLYLPKHSFLPRPRPAFLRIRRQQLAVGEAVYFKYEMRRTKGKIEQGGGL